MPLAWLFLLFFQVDYSEEMDVGQHAETDFGEMSLEELLQVEVVTASKSAQKLADAPATLYVFTDTMIAELGYRTLDQLLETIPEVELQHMATPEAGNLYTLRGISGNNKFVVLMNGFRINSPTGDPHYVGRNYSLAQAKRVEVILGPASALYGADAFGGIVNIITKTGEDSRGSQLYAAGAGHGAGDYGVAYGYSGDDLRLIVDGHLTQTDDRNLLDDYADEFQWYREVYSQNGQVLASPFDSRVIETGTPRPFDLSAETKFIHLGLDAKSFQIGLVHLSESHSSSMATRPEYNLYTEDAIYETLVESWFAKHTLERDRFSIQSSISRGYNEVTPDSNFQNTFTQYQRGYKYGYGKTVKIEEQLNWSPSSRHQLVAGISYEDISELARTGDLPFKFNPDLPADLQGQYYVGTNILDRDGNDLTVEQQFFYVDYQNTAAYIQYQGNWDSLLLTLGFRFDDNTRYGSTTNPRAGIVWKPTSNWNVKLLYSEGYLAPSPYEAYRHYGAFAPADSAGNYTNDPDQVAGLRGPFWHLPNPNLLPEELVSSELTLSYRFDDNLYLAVDVYDTEIDQLVVQTVFVGSDPIYFPNGISFAGIPVDAAEIPTNAGTMSLQGGSVRLNFALPLGGFRLRGNLSYAYSDGDINDDTLAYSARDTLRLGLLASRGPFAANLNVLNRSKSYHPLTDIEGQHFYNDGFTRVDLYTHYQMTLSRLNLKVVLNASNLLDRRHTNVSRTSNEGFSAAPQPGRKIEAGLALRFGK